MDHVVIFEKSRAKDPEVVFVGQPVDDAEILFLVFNIYVNDHVLTRELNPVVPWVFLAFFVNLIALHHYKNVIWSSTAARVEHTPALSVGHSLQHQFKESGLVARRYQIVA